MGVKRVVLCASFGFKLNAISNADLERFVLAVTNETKQCTVLQTQLRRCDDPHRWLEVHSIQPDDILVFCLSDGQAAVTLFRAFLRLDSVLESKMLEAAFSTIKATIEAVLSREDKPRVFTVFADLATRRFFSVEVVLIDKTLEDRVSQGMF